MTATLNLTGTSKGTFAQRVLSTHDHWAPLALRLAGGAIFVAHGTQKLFGSFGGYGLEGTGQFFDSIGLTPGYLMALLAGAVEFLGGLALVVGLLVRPAAAALAFAMLIAVFAVHFANGFFLDKGGFEYALAMLALSVSLFFSGAGLASVDRYLSVNKPSRTPHNLM
ncbi:MAG: putative oxidoreductase MhqP [Pseudomonadota bacterium]